MTAEQHDRSRLRLYRGGLVTTIGVAHFVKPSLFEPLNKTLGFDHDARRHVLINGAVETTIGLTMMIRPLRKVMPLLSIAYSTYLTVVYIRSRKPRRTGMVRN
ncbi:hypothetical protein A5752_11695 [Mycobacterium sp. 852002-51961_SCH5331710]|nr:hypothetical protein A5752_11695 [Mycobacterium sp. 852002-51961_SCH5331710]